jgi:hypothetical protein
MTTAVLVKTAFDMVYPRKPNLYSMKLAALIDRNHGIKEIAKAGPLNQNNWVIHNTMNV